ncbi:MULTISPECIES: hypothetical protein [Sphingobium]|uniref:hypothetical protein n=1 Tax=Sphingobium TaxID=165695 RepID=UPI00159C8E9F|nr:hypothetical protein [Sphingobium sp. 15-1]
MSNRFLAYLCGERDRLNRVLAALTAAGKDDGAEIARLRILTLAVERQMDLWASDLVL